MSNVNNTVLTSYKFNFLQNKHSNENVQGKEVYHKPLFLIFRNYLKIKILIFFKIKTNYGKNSIIS